MNSWNWFLAADDVGRWIITEGIAEVSVSKTNFKAVLRFAVDDAEPYHVVSGVINPNGVVTASVESPNFGNPPFDLTGQIGSANIQGYGVTTSIVLTDGTTIIGLANGPRSEKPYNNFPKLPQLIHQAGRAKSAPLMSNVRRLNRMSTRVDLEDLLAAVEWIGSGEAAGVDCEAYVSRDTGAIYWSGEGDDEELPEDIEDETKYVAVPGRSDLELGRSLALRFVQERLPDSYDVVSQYFRKKGAYSRFKSELERAGQLEAWYEYEQRATEQALREWGEQNGFVLERQPSSDGA